MYYCKKCGKPITEFDVNYGKHLSKNFNAKNCLCAKCQVEASEQSRTKEKSGSEELKIKEKYLMTEFNAHIWILCSLIPCVFMMIIFYALGIEDLPYDHYLTTTATVIAVVVIVFALICVSINIIRILKTWYKKEYVEEYVRGTHFETTLKSDGTFVTKEVTDYGGGGANLAASLTIMFFLFPIWWLPRFLYSLLYVIVHRISHKGKNKSEEFNKEAHEIAKKETPFYKMESNLSFPYVSVNGDRYILANQIYPADFLMRKNSKGNIEYLAIYDGYKVYDCNWIEEIDRKEWFTGDYSLIRNKLKFQLPLYEQALDNAPATETKNKI